MPELSRFEGMIIKMLFNDTIQHNKPMSVCIMENIRQQLESTVNYSQALFHTNS